MWREPSVRQILVTQASKFQLPQEEFQINPEQAMQKFREQFVGLLMPVGWGISESKGAAYADLNCQLFPKVGQAFGIPIFGSKKCLVPPQSGNRTNLWLKLIGIFTTAFVVSIVAPFCFDIWKRLRNQRRNVQTWPNKQESNLQTGFNRACVKQPFIFFSRLMEVSLTDKLPSSLSIPKLDSD